MVGQEQAQKVARVAGEMMAKRKPKAGKPATATNEELLLRESLSRVLCKALNRLSWSQQMLADKAGFSPEYISRVMHCRANCTVDTVGRLLFAIGGHYELVVRKQGSPTGN